jgi:[protein-PII] uridylyltransferase
VSQDFAELVELARTGSADFDAVTRQECVEATRNYAQAQWEAIRKRHCAGSDGGTGSSASGGTILRAITDTADTLVAGIVEFGLYQVPNRNAALSRISICALGGYGREELCPQSDLDVCLLYDSELGADVKALNEYLVPFLWDIGFQVGYALYSVSEAIELATQDPTMYTSFLQARRIVGDNTTFARFKLLLSEHRTQYIDEVFRFVQQREEPDNLSEAHRDLYATEPNVKESVGGLRDFHAGLWMII